MGYINDMQPKLKERHESPILEIEFEQQQHVRDNIFEEDFDEEEEYEIEIIEK